MESATIFMKWFAAKPDIQLAVASETKHIASQLALEQRQ